MLITRVIGVGLLFLSLLLCLVLAYRSSERIVTLRVLDVRPLAQNPDEGSATFAYLLTTTEGDTYNLADELFLDQTNLMDLYLSIKQGESQRFRVAGFAIPALGIHPNILSISSASSN